MDLRGEWRLDEGGRLLVRLEAGVGNRVLHQNIRIEESCFHCV